ncbi:MAG: hypothetical protein WBF90_25135 [Rivularia sp. (in: cyanobacteria)]
MFKKLDLIPYLATISRTPFAHGGNPQDRNGLATQAKPVCTGLKLVVYAGRLCLCSSGFNRRILLKHPFKNR